MTADPGKTGGNQAPRTVLLTGASAGIGLEIAQQLVTHGFEVWGTSRDAERLPKLSHFHPVQMDLSRLESIHNGFAQASNEAGEFDVLINNAGAGCFGPLDAMLGEIAREQFQLLVFGPLDLIRLVLPQMRQRKRGLIINVTSLAGQFPIPYMGLYSAAKAALGSLTACLRAELANTPVHAVEIRPGDINTGFFDATQRVAPTTAKDQTRASVVWETQLRNMKAAPPPQVVARAVLRLMNDPNPPPVVIVGGFFQARVAPLAARLSPPRVLERALRRFHHL